ncbi:unnamed protein product [Prunus armeniaca]
MRKSRWTMKQLQTTRLDSLKQMIRKTRQRSMEKNRVIWASTWCLSCQRSLEQRKDKNAPWKGMYYPKKVLNAVGTAK